MNKAQGYFGVKNGDFNIYEGPIPKFDLQFQSFTILSLKHCSNVINKSGHKLGSLWWEIGASLIRYRINKSSKPL